MATVVQTSMVAHLWAQREQETARTAIPSNSSGGGFVKGESAWEGSPRTWFRGDVLYSYHEPIARFVDGTPGPDGKTAYVLLTAGRPVGDVWNPDDFQKWSVATSNHMPGNAWESHAVRSFAVPSIAGRPQSRESHGDYDSERQPAAPDHGLNLEFLRTRFHNLARYFGNVAKVDEWARSSYDGPPDQYGHASRVVWPVADHVRASLISAWQAANEYAAAFDVDSVNPWTVGAGSKPWPQSVQKVVAIAAPLGERLERLEAARNTPEAIAKREAAEKKRKATKARRERLHYHGTPEERIAEWRAGGPASVLRHGDAASATGGNALLRVKGKRLETSQGVHVPLKDAIRVFQFAKLCRENAAAAVVDYDADSVVWKRNGARVRVGDFQLDEIRADGGFRAGCHNLEWPEIVSAAKQAGVLDIEASREAVKESAHV